MLVERFGTICLLVGLAQFFQMKGICITEEKDPVLLTEIAEQLDTFGRKIQQQGVPGFDDVLIAGRQTCQLFYRIDELPVVDFSDLVIGKERGSMSVSEIFAEGLRAKPDKRLFCELVVEIDDDTAQIEDDIFDALHEANLMIYPMQGNAIVISPNGS